MKQCTECGDVKSRSEFHRNSRAADGRQWKCKLCISDHKRERRKNDPSIKLKTAQSMKRWRERNPGVNAKRLRSFRLKNQEKILWRQARRRAREKKLSFSITVKDIVIPKVCPVLGIEINSSGTRDYWPSIDRTKPYLGYVKGNISVISYRANRIKNDASADELRKIYIWMKSRTREVKV